jgi:cytoskeleton protein RodZ
VADNADTGEPARAPATALGIGERLRSARKAKALSVHQVAEVLRLEEPGVLALEEGRFEAMGAPVFVRGHLRRYAQLVGLSPEAVLDAYRAATPGSDAPPALARPRTQVDAVRVPQWVYWAAGLLVLVGLVLALGNGDEEPPAPAALVVTPVTPGVAPAPTGAADTPPSGLDAVTPAPADADPAAPVPAPAAPSAPAAAPVAPAPATPSQGADGGPGIAPQ